MDQEKTYELDGRTVTVLTTSEQADTLISDETIADALEGWFGEYKGVPAEAFIDCLSDRYGWPTYGGSGWEAR